jgi:Protein of unknown function (DUF4038)/Putative collagen-binding domain of a collagenase
MQLPAPASLPALPAAAQGDVFPLHVEAGKPYLIDASNRPFMIVGDSAWSLLAQLSRPQIDSYLEDRRQRGYNAVLVNVLESFFATQAPRNSEGFAPFSEPRNFKSALDFVKHVDYGSPNVQYFELLDYLVRTAAEKNMLVMAAPSYAGYEGGEQGWWVGMKDNGPKKMRQYGEFLGHRYRAQRNMLWVQGGDFNVPDRTLVREIAEGILTYDAEKLHTFHAARGTGAHDWMAGEPWLSLGNIYTAEVVYEAAEEHGARRPGVPFILIEAYYEGAKPDPQLNRAQAYQALLSGATGQLSGHDVVWQFKAGWQQALESPTSRSMSRLSELFRATDWWKLRPDLSHKLLIDGAGSGVERALAASAHDGSFAIAYTPALRRLEFNTSALAGPRINAKWIDPLSGTRSSAPGAPFARSARQSLQPPGPNSAGLTDWVLFLESSP